MEKSTPSHPLATTLAALTGRARTRGLSDTDWAARAGVRKETLSRLRRRQSCDFETLRLLAQAVGADLGVKESAPTGSTSDGHFPAALDRAYEEQLVELGA